MTNIELGNQHVQLHMLPIFASALGLEAQDLLPSDRHDEATESVLPKRLLKLHGSDPETRAWIERVVAGGSEPKG